MTRVLLITLFLFMVYGCNDEHAPLTQSDIEKNYQIEHLRPDTYYFPAKKHSEDAATYLPLKPFDMLFTGHNLHGNQTPASYGIPGRYTHMLLYIGKDDEGFAYGVEMNTDHKETYHIDATGLKVKGKLYVYCLGSDYGQKECPQDLYVNGLETYDYIWAKRLKPLLYDRVKKHRRELINTIKHDLQNDFPFQLPFHVGADTFLTKAIPLIDDGRKNGADCTAYIASLFEEVAGICLEHIRITAPEIESYFLNDPTGKETILPAESNPFTHQDMPVSDLFTKMGYTLVDTSRPCKCDKTVILRGIPLPQRIFESSSVTEIVPEM